MRATTRRIACTWLGAFTVLAAMGATIPTSERYGYRTFRERVGGVTVLADTTAAAHDPKSPYVPIAVAVRLALGTPNATISLESFALIDAGGNRVSAAGAMEIRKRYGRAAQDVIRTDLTIGQQFSGDVEVPSRFYGDRSGVGIVQDRVNLAPSSWFHDVVFFPRPPTGLDGVLTLQLTGGGLETPIEVRFPVTDDAVAR